MWIAFVSPKLSKPLKNNGFYWFFDFPCLLLRVRFGRFLIDFSVQDETNVDENLFNNRFQVEVGIRRSDKCVSINSTHANFNLPPSLTKVRQSFWELCGTACIAWENLGHGMRETRVIWLCFSWEWKGGFVISLCFQWRIHLACDGHWPDLHCFERI